MTIINRQRMTAELDGDFVVFLIGMRINRFRGVGEWLSVFGAMPRMLRELGAADGPEGLLGYWSGLAGPRSPFVVQYWRSFEALEAYARSPDAEHLPAWGKYNQAFARNGAVGIWHETYLVRAGEYETVYNNMPVKGLGAVGKLVPATGRREEARDRIGPVAVTVKDEEPVTPGGGE